MIVVDAKLVLLKLILGRIFTQTQTQTQTHKHISENMLHNFKA